MRHKVAVYGTLKRGYGNYTHIIAPYPHDYLGTIKVPNFRLYHIERSGIPIAVYDEENTDYSLEVEILSLSTIPYVNTLNLEVGAGYDIFPLSNNTIIFGQSKEDYLAWRTRMNLTEISSGIWDEHKERQIYEEDFTNGNN